MEEIWRGLKTHFSRVENALDDLRDPISQKNAQSIRSKLGQSQVVDQLLESLRIHDGQNGDFFLIGPWRLSSSDQILRFLKRGFFSRVFGDSSHTAPIIIADNGGNSWLELDLESGAITDVWEDGDEVILPSYRALLERALIDMEQGILVFDMESTGYVVADDPDKNWPIPT